MSTVPSPATTTEALGMLRAAMGYLTAADATAMAAETQARCLQALEQATAMGTAARTSILAAFTSGQGYCADADYSPRAWLIHKTRVTKGAAVGYTAWVRRAAAHPQVARCWPPGRCRSRTPGRSAGGPTSSRRTAGADADAILVAAAGAGMDLRDLAALAAEIYARSLPDAPDRDEDEAFEDRSVRLETTFEGAGVLTGDLTPECAAVVAAVLDALSAPAGAEDTRTQRAAVPRRAARGDAPAGRRGPAAGAGRAAGQGLGRTSRWRTCCCWTAAPRCRRSGPPGSAPSGPRTARPPRRAGVTAARGWTATRPPRWRATRPWPRS